MVSEIRQEPELTAAPALSDAELDDAAASANADDTFENAAPLPIPALVERTDRDEEISRKPLPSLDEVVARIPAETKQTLEALFRARFTAVRRAPRDLVR